MGILNNIFGVIDFDTQNQFDDLLKNHREALDNWLRGGYRPRSIIPEKERVQFNQYDDTWSNIYNNTGRGGLVEYFNYEQKCFVVRHKFEIINLYSIFSKYNEIFKKILNLAEKYPYAINFITNKYGNFILKGFYFQSLGNQCGFFLLPEEKEIQTLTNEQQNIIFSHQSELYIENERIKAEIKEYEKKNVKAQKENTSNYGIKQTKIVETYKYKAYRYPNATCALDAKKQFYNQYGYYAKHCFKNIQEPGFIIFDTKKDLNMWYKEHTGHYFYDDEPEPGVKFTKEDAIKEIKNRYELVIDKVLRDRDYSKPILAIGFQNAFGNRMYYNFVISTNDSDIEYRFSIHYQPYFIRVENLSNEQIKEKTIDLIYKFYYKSRFAKRIEASNNTK